MNIPSLNASSIDDATRPTWRKKCTRNGSGALSMSKSGISGLAFAWLGVFIHTCCVKICLLRWHAFVYSDAVRYQKKLKVQLNMEIKKNGQASSEYNLSARLVCTGLLLHRLWRHIPSFFVRIRFRPITTWALPRVTFKKWTKSRGFCARSVDCPKIGCPMVSNWTRFVGGWLNGAYVNDVHEGRAMVAQPMLKFPMDLARVY